MDEHFQALIQWEAPEHRHYSKSADWYWGMGIAALIGAGLAFYFGNFLLAILIAIGAVVLGFYSAREPRVISFAVTENGIIAGKRLYPYSTLSSFTIITTGGDAKLLIESKKTLVPPIAIPLEDISAEEVYECISPHLEENEELDEPLLDHIAHFLKL